MTSLTVIVPFYDETAFLKSALASIRGQGIDDLQLIVVNDNPDVFSHDYVERLAAPYDAQVLSHPQNLGLSAARNTGMAVATGVFVGFLDADDYYVPDGLKAHLAYALVTQADMVHAPTYFTQPGAITPKMLPRDALFFCQERTAKGLKSAESAQFITSSWSSLYRRAYLDHAELTFDVAQRKFEDRLFVLDAVTSAHRLAFFGRPTRVWRGRAGSISSSPTTPDIHLLQIQLLEKCEDLMRREVERSRLPSRFAKRELFNTVSRLIWDLDVIAAIQNGDDPIYANLADRIPALLGDATFGQQIFEDPVLAPISRVGMKTRKGRIRRTDFFTIHKALRDGDFRAAHDIMTAALPAPPRRPTPNKAANRLVLHLGMHKTGSTFLQHQLQAHTKALAKAGVLVPQTGLARQDNPLRPGATAGHQGLIAALRQDDPVVWASLGREIRRSGAQTVVISAENMLFPTAPDRTALIERLLDRLSGFDQIDVLAFVRRPEHYVEHFWREWVADGAAAGAQTLEAFMVDHAANLTNLPDLFGPFETHLQRKVQLADYDALRTNGLWAEFCALAGLPDTLPEQDTPRYPTPDRSTTEALRLINTVVPAGPRRRALLRAWLALHPAPQDQMALMPPDLQADVTKRWTEQSAAFAQDRGYGLSQPNSVNWTPFEGLDAETLDSLMQLLAQDCRPSSMSTAVDNAALAPQVHPDRGMALTIRLRPWVTRLIRRLKRQ